MFIKLTSDPTNESFFIRPEEIKGIYKQTKGESSIILLNHGDYYVKESQEEIIKMIEDSWGPKIKDSWGPKIKDSWGPKMKSLKRRRRIRRNYLNYLIAGNHDLSYNNQNPYNY